MITVESIYSGTGSTVRVCPDFTEERVTMSFELIIDSYLLGKFCLKEMAASNASDPPREWPVVTIE
jgi:hypothetical protein